MRWFDNVVSYFSTGQTADEIQAESDAADAKRKELNKQKADEYGPEWYAQTVANDEAGQLDVHAEIQQGFDQGLAEGQQNIANFASSVGDIATKTGDSFIGAIFRVIPWFVWVGLAVYVAWQLGAFKKLRSTP